MNISQDDANQYMAAFITATDELEKQLSDAGVSQAHDWMFAIREMLYDTHRLNLCLIDLFNSTDEVDQVPVLLREVVETILYEIIPHVQRHMDELEQSLASGLLESKFPNEDSSKNKL